MQVQVAHAGHGPLPGQLLLRSTCGEKRGAFPNLLHNRVHKADTNRAFNLLTQVLQLEADLGGTSPPTGAQ